MKGEKGMAGVTVGEGLSEDLSEDSFSKWNTSSPPHRPVNEPS